MKDKKQRNPAAVILGSAGGNARVAKSTLEQRQAWGKKGGRPKNIRCPECGADSAIKPHDPACPFYLAI